VRPPRAASDLVVVEGASALEEKRMRVALTDGEPTEGDDDY
jgi:hypothetical protein